MKKLSIAAVAVFLLSAVWVFAHEDIGKHAACHLCGMDRTKFAHSRVLIEYDDGTTAGTCSVHCTAIDLAVNIDKTPKAIKVGDYFTRDLIDAETAVWVIDGSKPGVMSKRAKWAFGKRDAAELFIKENSGTLATFDEVMKAAYEDMYADTKMIRDKRKMMKMKMSGGK
jgi:copper chaperone NosL